MRELDQRSGKGRVVADVTHVLHQLHCPDLSRSRANVEVSWPRFGGERGSVHQ